MGPDPRPALTGALFLLLAACSRPGPPFSPKDALETFRIERGFRIQTFLSEPDVVSPVAMEFDHDGRIYVVEDRGYPLDTSRVGRVKLIEDTDFDGQPDKATVFADRLMLPTGVMRWQKGILVTDAPDVLYLEDTDGDGRADVRQVVLTGFAFTNPQHTVNSPVYGLDNWIYLAHENPTTAVVFQELFGDRGGDIRSPGHPTAALKERGRNVRFRPGQADPAGAGPRIEALSGNSQFGQAFTEWGDHLVLNNSNHARHTVIAARYLARNPELLAVSAMADISDHGPASTVFPVTERPRFEMLSGLGRFTSAAGLTLYAGRLFVAEPAHNLVHQDVLQESGATYVARRGQEGREFLASTDSWFRPVNFTVGPDGALYVLDFYRLVIEHPEWMSTRTHQSPELSAGRDRGRIYRITPASGLPLARGLRLSSASGAGLASYLEHPNPWWRRTAQRLLIERQAVEAVPELVRLLEASGSPLGRLHALWTLEGLGKLEASQIRRALGDREPGVRRNAILLAETRLAELAPALLALERDPDPKVRFQLLCTLGFVATPEATAARRRLLERDFEDRWFQAAALSSPHEDALAVFPTAVARFPTETAGATDLFRLLGSMAAGRKLERLLDRLLAPGWWRPAVLEGVARAKPIASPRTKALLLNLFHSQEAGVRRAALGALEISGLPQGARSSVEQAAGRALDSSVVASLRADSLALLALADAAAHRPLFERLLDPQQPEEVQAAAARALGRIRGEPVGAFLLGRWRSLTARVRMEAADALYADHVRLPLVIAALQKGEMQPWTLGFRHRNRLLMHPDSSLREQARALLEHSAGEREQVLRRYQAALGGSGDAVRGRQIFRRVCSKCHRLGGIGFEMGPDLATVRHQPRELLLEEILLPSRAVAQGYEAYVVETVSGGAFDGVLAAETPHAITLRHEDGKQDVIARKDIRRIYSTHLSAMPADLEKEISLGQMADLLEYLKKAQ
ncbi:MAG: c-type cytochrome [Acidobacteria bacterium]|nr:c-type cytochrome [Acidobacteriota bacterium]